MSVGSLYRVIKMDDDEEEDDETLNVESEQFNPLHALYSKKLIVPFPSAPVLDNVAMATSLLSKNKNLDEKIVRVKKVKDLQPSTSKIKIDAAEDSKKGADKKPQQNVLTRMSDSKGPLGFLKTCMEKRVRVKVWTRSSSEIRGYCIGFLAAFDKHWNLALEDVQEVWTRRTKRKSILFGKPHPTPIGWKAMGPMLIPPKVKVTKLEKGKEKCERHVKKMVVRGEQIAFISVSGT